MARNITTKTVTYGGSNGTFTAEVGFSKADDGAYNVHVNGEVVGRVEKTTDRFAQTGGTRIAYGYTELKGWRAVGVRYATTRPTRLEATCQLVNALYVAK